MYAVLLRMVQATAASPCGRPARCLLRSTAHDLRAAVEPVVRVPQILKHLQVEAAEVILRILLTQATATTPVKTSRDMSLHAAGVPDLNTLTTFDLGSGHTAAV